MATITLHGIVCAADSGDELAVAGAVDQAGEGSIAAEQQVELSELGGAGEGADADEGEDVREEEDDEQNSKDNSEASDDDEDVEEHEGGKRRGGAGDSEWNGRKTPDTEETLQIDSVPADDETEAMGMGADFATDPLMNQTPVSGEEEADDEDLDDEEEDDREGEHKEDGTGVEAEAKAEDSGMKELREDADQVLRQAAADIEGRTCLELWKASYMQGLTDNVAAGRSEIRALFGDYVSGMEGMPSCPDELTEKAKKLLNNAKVRKAISDVSDLIIAVVDVCAMLDMELFCLEGEEGDAASEGPTKLVQRMLGECGVGNDVPEGCCR